MLGAGDGAGDGAGGGVDGTGSGAADPDGVGRGGRDRAGFADAPGSGRFSRAEAPAGGLAPEIGRAHV